LIGPEVNGGNLLRHPLVQITTRVLLPHEAVGLLRVFDLLLVVVQLLLSDIEADLSSNDLFADFLDIAQRNAALEYPVVMATLVLSDAGGAACLMRRVAFQNAPERPRGANDGPQIQTTEGHAQKWRARLLLGNCVHDARHYAMNACNGAESQCVFRIAD